MEFQSAVLGATVLAVGQRASNQRRGRNSASLDLRGMAGRTAGSMPHPGPKDGQRMNDPLAHLHRAAGTAR